LIGLGRGLAELFLSRPNNIVVAAVRDPTSESSQSLLNATTGVSSTVILVKIDSISETDAKDAVRILQDQHGITHLDVVIANAGQSSDLTTVSTVTMAEMRHALAVNSYGPILLFQAVLPLLEKSRNPIFATMGSMMGTTGGMEQRPYPGAPYGPSKAVLNWITRKVHFEHENIIAFVLDPGYVALKHVGAESSLMWAIGIASFKPIWVIRVPEPLVSKRLRQLLMRV
jgi:norsolorinic acid ketoreductase